MTLVKQIEGVLLAWREDLSGQFAEDAAIVVASHFQPVTAEEVVERAVDVYEWIKGGPYPDRERDRALNRQRVIRILEALGPAYVVKE